MFKISRFRVFNLISGKGATSCERQYQGKDRSDYIPRCSPDGRFENKQCVDDECFCVDANGDKLSETNVLLSNGRPNCTTSRLGKALPNLSLNNSGISSLANLVVLFV